MVSWVPTGRPVHTGCRLPWVILGALGYGVVAGCLALVTQAEECRLSGPCAVPKDWLAGRAVSPQPGQVLGCQSLTIRRKNDMSRYPESSALASLLLVSNLTCVHINA